MKIFCVITPSHRVLYERFFLPSLDTETFHVVPCEMEQSGKGEFLAQDFKAAIEFKVRKIIESIRENLGDIIIWSDVDIQFFDFKPNHIFFYFQQNADLAIQRLTKKGDNVCGGFYAIRCSEKTAGFFERVLQTTLNETNGNEQDALNKLLSEIPCPLSWRFLGREFYARTHGLDIPSRAVIHHATCILPVDHVKQKIQMLAGLENFHHWSWFKKQLRTLKESKGALKRKLS